MSVLSTVSFLIATGTILSTLILLYLQILIPAHAYDSFILHLPQLKLNIHNTDGTRIQVGMNPSLPYHTNILPNDNSRLLGNTEGKGTGSAFARSILDGSVYFYHVLPSLNPWSGTGWTSPVWGLPVPADIDIRITIYEDSTTASPRELDVCISLIHRNQSMVHTLTSLKDAPSCTGTYLIGNEEIIFDGKAITILNVIPTMVAFQYQHPPGARLYIDVRRMVPMVEGARAGKGDQYNVSFTFSVTPSSVSELSVTKKKKKISNTGETRKSGYVLILPFS